ncbi:MAG: very short patch repair endonuclease [Nanoarchaeota archaeon]
MTDIFAKEKRSEIMSKIKSRETKLEIEFRKALWSSGVRGYRKNKKIERFCTPDIVFSKKKVAVFLDSDFWHGRKNTPKTNKKFWIAKFKRNIARDKKVKAVLKKRGWAVIRFSETKIKEDFRKCVEIVKKTVF